MQGTITNQMDADSTESEEIAEELAKDVASVLSARPKGKRRKEVRAGKVQSRKRADDPMVRHTDHIIFTERVGTVQFAPVWRAVRAFFDAICDKRSPHTPGREFAPWQP